MSWRGVTTGWPSAGFRMLRVDSMRCLASACAAAESGTCTAIWSPSKSAPNASHTSGWIWMALPSMSCGMKAWMPRRCSVGARLRRTGWSLMTSSRTSHTSGRSRSTMRFALLMLCAKPLSTSCRMTNGLNSSRAIFFGSPHWWSLRSLPTTMTVRRDDREDGQDHPVRARVRLEERLDEPKPLDGLLAALAARGAHLGLELVGELLQIERADDLEDRLGAHLGLEEAVLLHLLAELGLGHGLHPLDALGVGAGVARGRTDLLDVRRDLGAHGLELVVRARADVGDALLRVLPRLRLRGTAFLHGRVDLLRERALELREHRARHVVALVREREVGGLEDDVLRRRLLQRGLELLLHARGGLRERFGVLGELVLLRAHRGLG